MPEIFKTTTSMGKLTVEAIPSPLGPSAPPTLLITIKRLGFKKVFGRDKISSVDSGSGGGSPIGMKTMRIHLPGEVLTLRNVPSKNADELQRLLS